jgi:signal transduction histidine kinase
MKMMNGHSFKEKLKDKIIISIDNYITKYSLLCIMLVYNIVILITAAALYKVLPILMSYEENFRINTTAVSFSYDIQFVVSILVMAVLSTSILLILFKDINTYKLLSVDKKEDLNKLKSIRKKCMNMPYIIYLCQITIPVIIAMVIAFLGWIVLNITLVLAIKLVSVVFSFCFLTAIISYTFARRIFSRILYDTYIGQDLEGFRIKIGTKILIQVIPMIITSILITSLFGYSKLIDEKGELLQETYRIKIEESLKNTENITDAVMLFEKLEDTRLKNIKTTYFLADKDGSIITSDGTSLSTYIINYINKPIEGYKIYSNTKEKQGIIRTVNLNGQESIVGVIFVVRSPSTVIILTAALIIMLIISLFAIYCFSKSISEDISHVANSFMKIGQAVGIEERKSIPVISNDEIGDLVIAFNRIQRLETEYDEMKNEFFANVSHELRTPLNIILAAVQLLSTMEKSGEDDIYGNNINKISDMIKQNSYRLLRLVNNLIDTGKIRASFYDVHMKNHNIVSVVEEISLSVANYIKGKEINFIFDTDIEERIMACDADMIERIMLNLLSNAVKFTAAGGDIFVRIQEQKNNIIVSVKDSGIGMTLDELKIIFERFKQSDKSLTRKREGSGIGLSLVKLLVEMHMGSISVSSEVGKGSEFIITLPVRVMQDEDSEGYLDRQIYGEKVEASIEKIKIEFSDINF